MMSESVITEPVYLDPLDQATNQLIADNHMGRETTEIVLRKGDRPIAVWEVSKRLWKLLWLACLVLDKIS